MVSYRVFVIGGNASFIVFEDADIDDAIEGLIASKFRNTGQTCVCTNRVYVHAEVYEIFKEKLTSRMSSMQLGPLINQQGVSKAKRLVDNALNHGATLLVGKIEDIKDNFFPATLLGNMTQEMALSKEEVFGPVVGLFKFEDENQVISMANDTDFGLASYFYSRDIGRCWRVAEKLECGIVGVNTGVISTVQAPFGGVKESGLGREGSVLGLEEYCETKYICMGGLDK